MFFKMFLFYFFSILSLTVCDKSFTIVLDTTVSMQEELDVLRANLGAFLNTLDKTDIANYIIVPFNEEVQDPVISHSPREILSWLNTVSVSGGRACPEYSLSGIERALQLSKPQSTIFLFTDAYSKDSSKLRSIQHLCKTTSSQVVIFLSGYCLPSRTASTTIDVYYNVTDACSGAVVHFEPSTLRQAFKFMKHVTTVDWSEVRSYGRFVDYKQFSLPVHSFATDILLVFSGEQPMVEITDPDGSTCDAEKVVDTKNTQILRLGPSTAGRYTATVRCKNKPTSAVLYMRYELPIRFGFATKSPRSLKETSAQPLPGHVNHILFYLTQMDLKIISVEIQMASGEKKPLDLEENNTNMFLAKTLVEPEKEFRFWIKCNDTSNPSDEIKIPTPIIRPQRFVTDASWLKPTAEIIESQPVVVMWRNNATLACKVNGYPKPNIWWEDDTRKTLPSEDNLLEIPSVYISYVTLEKFQTNTTIYCKSKNSQGTDSQQVTVVVNRPFSFEVKQSPKDQTIEYGYRGKLPCEVSAYPEAKIKWYFNDNLRTEKSNLHSVIEEDGLSITNMSPNDVGKYKCHISNGVVEKTFTANIQISGIEAPKLEIDKPEYTLNLGDWTNLECRIIKGKPSPTLTWKYKSETDYDFGDLPDGVIETYDGKLKIGSVQKNHRGTYKCEAVNVEGKDSAEVVIKVKYAPIITSIETNEVEVREEDDVELHCNVDASPVAEVRWELSQGDVLIPLDSRHVIDEQHTLRFPALWRDSGKYHCIAENEVGKTDTTITVNVLVPPYIQAPRPNNVSVRVGASVVLECRVTYGNPVPTTKWEFVALDSTTTVLSRSKSSTTLHLFNVTKADEGEYLCIAENKVTTDRIKYYLNVE